VFVLLVGYSTCEVPGVTEVAAAALAFWHDPRALGTSDEDRPLRSSSPGRIRSTSLPE
jgi:hypothetical protein